MDEIVERISTQKIYRAAKGVRDEGTKGWGKRDVGRGRGEGGRGEGGEGEENEGEREREGEIEQTNYLSSKTFCSGDTLLSHVRCEARKESSSRYAHLERVHALWHRACEKKGTVSGECLSYRVVLQDRTTATGWTLKRSPASSSALHVSLR